MLLLVKTFLSRLLLFSVHSSDHGANCVQFPDLSQLPDALQGPGFIPGLASPKQGVSRPTWSLEKNNSLHFTWQEQVKRRIRSLTNPNVHATTMPHLIAWKLCWHMFFNSMGMPSRRIVFFEFQISGQV